jgi:hypothetical protein
MAITGGFNLRSGPPKGFWSGKVPVSADKIHRQWKEEMVPVLEAFKKELERPTETWDHKVSFVIRFQAKGSSYVGVVYTSDKIYRYLNAGTRPHIIRARRAKRLAFFSGGFVAKTSPGSLNAGSGRRADSGFTRPMVVHHPGTVAREWTRVAAEASYPIQMFTSTVRKILLDVFR